MEISEAELATCEKICSFLESFHENTEHQSGQQYVTLSFSLRLFERLEIILGDEFANNDGFLSDVAKKMLRKLESYYSLVKTPLVRFAKTVNVQFRND